MSKFIFTETDLRGVFVVEPTVFGDARGYFTETYNKAEFEKAGIHCDFVQDNQSGSQRGVLRGLHFQKTHPQTKLVRVISGEVYDVAVDLRKDSETFLKWTGVLLSSKNRKQLFIPRGFAHGFVVVSEYAEFAYKCDDFYHPDDEGTIAYNDPQIAVDWKFDGEIILSEKDKKNPAFADIHFFF